MDALLQVNLPVPASIPWDEYVLSQLREKVERAAFEELDRLFGGDSWCFQVQPITIQDRHLIRLDLGVSSSVDAKQVFATFEKHWKDVITDAGGGSFAST